VGRFADELRLRELMRDREYAPKQVMNTWRDANVTPLSQGPANTVKAAWAPVRGGQAIPLLGERTYGPEWGCPQHGESCDCLRP
jgi:hypothetical protein